LGHHGNLPKKTRYCSALSSARRVQKYIEAAEFAFSHDAHRRRLRERQAPYLCPAYTVFTPSNLGFASNQVGHHSRTLKE
jgi:hypothetical protein